MGNLPVLVMHSEADMKMLFSVIFCILTVTSAQTLPEILTREGASTLVELIAKAELTETLSGDGPFTVFAPTNEAFDKMDEKTREDLMANPEILKKVLLYHVVGSEIKSSDITQEDVFISSSEPAGSKLRINTYMKRFYYDGFLTVNGKRISRTDVMASNGVIHFITDVIDVFANDDCTKVLKDQGNFNTLLAAIEKAELVETLQSDGPFTILAPTDEAFAEIGEDKLNTILEDKDLLTKILLRHVLPNAKFAKGIVWELLDTAGDEQIATHVFKNGVTKIVSEDSNGNRLKAKIVDTDLICSNGVVHAIDTVI